MRRARAQLFTTALLTDVLSPVAESIEVRRARAQRDADELKARRRALGNMQFVGFLYRKALITEKIVHFCIGELLGDPIAEELECACKLLSTVGANLEV